MTPIDAKDAILEGIQKKLGFVPNVYKEMAKAPAALEVYVKGNEALDKGALKPHERQAVMLAVSTAKKCGYCRAAHTMLAKRTGVSPGDIEALRVGQQPLDARLKALTFAARLILAKRGWLEAEDLTAIEAGGVDRPPGDPRGRLADGCLPGRGELGTLRSRSRAGSALV